MEEKHFSYNEGPVRICEIYRQVQLELNSAQPQMLSSSSEKFHSLGFFIKAFRAS